MPENSPCGMGISETVTSIINITHALPPSLPGTYLFSIILYYLHYQYYYYYYNYNWVLLHVHL